MSDNCKQAFHGNQDAHSQIHSQSSLMFCQAQESFYRSMTPLLPQPCPERALKSDTLGAWFYQLRDCKQVLHIL